MRLSACVRGCVGSPVALELTPLLATLLGALAALLLVGAAVVAALRVRARTGGGGGGGAARPAALALKEKAAAAAAAAAGGRQPLRADAGADVDRDEKNPDVIPCTNESEYAGAETPGPLQALLSPTFAAPTAAEAQLRNGDLRSAFKGGGAAQPPPPRQAVRAPRCGAQGDEVQYAELRLPRSGSASSSPPAPPLDSASAAAALYAQMEHARWGAAAALPLPAGGALPCREVVTVRTPLMMGDCAQESCV
ncbi:hypothetical protein R5R35_002030 [Gryllus longicercus]|uniref:Uncharacterized protein n=1 Tax=Gryllus longicercus TaxID=2509291 RepID=A0AAN9VJJ3_9ORTH